jgi:predicted alpha/beta-fold hydrolase
MIDNISIPVLILNSKDDLITTKSEKHLEAIIRNENVLFAETERGGHVCWFSGTNPKRWYPKPTIEFLKAF